MVGLFFQVALRVRDYVSSILFLRFAYLYGLPVLSYCMTVCGSSVRTSGWWS